MGRSAYVDDVYAPSRRITREVRVGDVGIGGDNPIRIQSMTTTDTRDTLATCDQVERLVDADCEIVRVTAPSITDAENLREIKQELARRGVSVPLVADIHFTPNAAMIAAELVEKVRINPGNYADKKKFEVREYSEQDYEEEIERVSERFRPLVLACKKNGAAMRIGTNHGSLSDRIMNRHGDTALGMVESAIEFLAVCESEGYRDIVFSMKASNPLVAIHAYRLLAARLDERAPGEPGYPFHVGVTEAGEGEDGRIKSAIGIGSLLEDGLGDTVRVSLTEDPVREIPVAAALSRRSERKWASDALPTRVETARDSLGPDSQGFLDPYAHVRRETKGVSLGLLSLGGGEPPRVELEVDPEAGRLSGWLAELATAQAVTPDLACESLRFRVTADNPEKQLEVLRQECRAVSLSIPVTLEVPGHWEPDVIPDADRVAFRVDRDVSTEALHAVAQRVVEAGKGVEWGLEGGPEEMPVLVDRALDVARATGAWAWVISVLSDRAPQAARAASARLLERGAADRPLVLRHRRALEAEEDEALLDLAVDLGAPLCDGLGDAISISGYRSPGTALDLAYRVLQGARLRTTRTEYISCPSCGRTLFDLEETTARIRGKTDHLKGVKIAVMGCIVNGPGEMADADFGYVGSGPGQVNLYVGQEVVARAVPETDAPDRLVDIIRDQGRWFEPTR